MFQSDPDEGYPLAHTPAPAQRAESLDEPSLAIRWGLRRRH